MPHEEISTKWHPDLRNRYFELLETCTHLTAESRPGNQDAVKKSLIRLIDYSGVVIAVYDPESRRGDAVDQAMVYLQNAGKPYLLIHPYTLELQLCTVHR